MSHFTIISIFNKDQPGPSWNKDTQNNFILFLMGLFLLFIAVGASKVWPDSNRGEISFK